MTMLTERDQTWVLKPDSSALETGAAYAACSLPWTFNRMMANTSSKGQQGRALNIAKGIVGQEMLRAALQERGLVADAQRKSYRDQDLFDFHIPIRGEMRRFDLKSFHLYPQYDASVGRPPFTSDYLTANLDYHGPDWRRFFPMLVPHTQINQDKEYYCFAIASSLDLRHDVTTRRSRFSLAAFPFGPWLPFLSSPRLCIAREEASTGFSLSFGYRPRTLFGSTPLHFKVIGEYAGKAAHYDIDISPTGTPTVCGPLSCVGSFMLQPESYEVFNGSIEVNVAHNGFTKPVFNSLRRNTNAAPDLPLSLMHGDFCNLYLPDDYTVFVLGWVTKAEFLIACRKYHGWVWPEDAVDRTQNRPWSRITANDRDTIAHAGFADCLSEDPSLVKAGFLKTHGRGGGACCYMFPNMGANGGVHETNLFVLPQDLHPMSDLLR